MDDKLLKLYNALKADGYELPADPEQFRRIYQDTAKFNALYDVLKADGYELPADPKVLYASYYGNQQAPIAVQTAPQAPIGEQFNTWEAASQAADGNPLLKFGMEAGRTLASTVSDLMPEQLAQLQLKGASIQRKEAEQALATNPENAKTYRGILGIGPTIEEIGQAATKAQPLLEQEIQTQKAEAATKLKGSVQDFGDIKSATDAASYIGNAIGQAAGQIPASVATLGASSFLMEAASIYDQQLDQLAEKHQISREEVIARGLDKPAEGEAWAVLAGALDAVSAGKVLDIFRKGVQKEIKKGTIKKFLEGFASEGITEGAQGVAEQLGAEQGSGLDKPIDWHDIANQSLAGAIGGGGLSVVSSGGKQKKELDAIEKDINSVSTGDPKIDQTLDEDALENAAYINKVLDVVDAAEPGMKATDLIKKVEDELEQTQQELEETQRKYARSEMLLGLNALPVVEKPVPPMGNFGASEENEMGPGVDAVTEEKAIAMQKEKEDRIKKTLAAVELPMEFVPDADLVKHENPRELRIVQKDIKKEYANLKNLIKCLTS